MRTAEISRKTKETDIKLSLCLDGGEVSVDTGVGFFDHMLNLFFTHAGFGASVNCKGDLQVDAHHTVEDVGIALGEAFNSALGDKVGIARYGSLILPMDETVVLSAVDIGGRPFITYKCDDMTGACGNFDLELVEEFFRAFAFNAKINVYINLLEGKNCHHKAEGVFKSVARSLRAAVKIVDDKLPSTKGVI